MAQDKTTPQERSEQLRQQLGTRAAVRTLDTFEAAGAEAASPVEDAPVVASAVDSSRPGFGQTDSTEVTGDQTMDQDLDEQAGHVENEHLAEGQNALDAFHSARKEGVAALAPEEDQGGQFHEGSF